MSCAFDPLIAAWQSGNAHSLTDLFTPTARWTIDGEALEANEIALTIGASLETRPHVHITLRRAFQDLRDSAWWAGEWVLRSSVDGQAWDEIEQGLLLQTAPDGRIATLRTHNDHGSVRQVSRDAPVRDEHWPKWLPPASRPLDHDQIVALQHRHVMSGWRTGSEDMVISCHGETGLIQTSFELVRGHEQLRHSVRNYFANYADTHIDIHHIVFDGEWLAINQTWRCTNRLTGVHAGDQDLNIGIIREGKLWRWREYYDSRKSAQTAEQTAFGKPS